MFFIFCVLCFSNISCKKNLHSDPNITTSQDILFGLDTVSEADMKGTVAVEDMDTSKIYPLTLGTYPSSWIIDVPPAGHQRFNDCTAWSAGYGLMSYYYNVIDGNPGYNNLDSTFSPLYIYNQLNEGLDSGITFKSALDLVQKQGCSRWFWMPEDKLTFTSEVSGAAVNDASYYTISEWHPFRTVNVQLIKSFISKNYPILFAAKIYESFAHDSTPSIKIWKARSRIKPITIESSFCKFAEVRTFAIRHYSSSDEIVSTTIGIGVSLDFRTNLAFTQCSSR
jgi:hypothetical protein